MYIKTEITAFFNTKQTKQMTPKQKEHFNRMLNTLKTIKEYQSAEKLRKDSEKDWGLDYTEALEMSYENIQTEAKFCIKSIKPIL